MLPSPLTPKHPLILLTVLTSPLSVPLELCGDCVCLGTRRPMGARSGLPLGARFLLAELVCPLCPGAQPLLHHSVVAAVVVLFLPACPMGTGLDLELGSHQVFFQVLFEALRLLVRRQCPYVSLAVGLGNELHYRAAGSSNP